MPRLLGNCTGTEIQLDCIWILHRDGFCWEMLGTEHSVRLDLNIVEKSIFEEQHAFTNIFFLHEFDEDEHYINYFWLACTIMSF